MNDTQCWKALSDPVRRRILELLATRGPLNVKSLAVQFDISRQAVSKHVGELEEGKLVTVIREHRESLVILDPTGLAQAQTWIEAIGNRWGRTLAGMKL